MRCLLGWIGSDSADSDVNPLFVALDRFGEFAEVEFLSGNCVIGGGGISTLKKRLLFEWPQAKTVTPKTVSEVKLIHGGKVLENSKTLADSRIMSFGNLPGGVITMHVVVQPTIAKEKKAKNQKEMQKMNSCSCTIL
ncbi:hypothetical protein ACLB2K_014250 [Fragaria x ananassa]